MDSFLVLKFKFLNVIMIHQHNHNKVQNSVVQETFPFTTWPIEFSAEKSAIINEIISIDYVSRLCKIKLAELSASPP